MEKVNKHKFSSEHIPFPLNDHRLCQKQFFQSSDWCINCFLMKNKIHFCNKYNGRKIKGTTAKVVTLAAEICQAVDFEIKGNTRDQC